MVFSCQSIGKQCSFSIHLDHEEDVMVEVVAHLKQNHRDIELSDGLMEKIKGQLKGEEILSPLTNPSQ